MKLNGHYYGHYGRLSWPGPPPRRLATAMAMAVIVLGAALNPLYQASAGTLPSASAPPVTLPQSPANISLGWAVPNYPVGRQMRWLLGAVTKPPVPTAELKAHFDPRFLALVPPARFNRDLESLHLVLPLRIVTLTAGLTTSVLEAEVATGPGRLGLVMSVDAQGLIEALQVSPSPSLPPVPKSWAALDAQVRSLAPDVSLEVATIPQPTLTSTAATTGPASTVGAAGTTAASATTYASTSPTTGTGTTPQSGTSVTTTTSTAATTTTTTPPGAQSAFGACHVVNSIAPMTARPLGSMFKLYVLATLANEVKSGRLSWGQEVALTPELRSLPSGVEQIEPAGTGFTVNQLAQLMISSSDNTAADELSAVVGRSALEDQVATTSADASLDLPFLRTRELFVLKYADYPHYANAYLALPDAARTAYLDNIVDQVPLSDVDINAASGGSPRAISSIEWFASPADICNLYSQLYSYASSPALAPVSTALSYNNDGITLAPSAWPLLWFKGGSEQGVLTLSCLARRANGTVVVVVLQLSDPAKALANNVSLSALADVQAVFGLIPSSSGG
jgi:hypothetical protein